MPLTDTQRNDLRNIVHRCRTILFTAISDLLVAEYGIYRDGRIDEESALPNLSAEARAFRRQLVTHLQHRRAALGDGDAKRANKTAVEMLTREVAFTHLNRLCAFKMLTARKLIADPVGRGADSRGFVFYCANVLELAASPTGEEKDRVYRDFLIWQAAQLAEEMESLFSADDPANYLFPKPRTLEEILSQLNRPDIAAIWADDETIGWVYQFFTPREHLDELRKASAAPRNSYEMAVRNQFFTPRYVVEFLTDNTLGRTWWEMRGGNTRLMDTCRFFSRSSDPVFVHADTEDFRNHLADSAAFVEALERRDAEAVERLQAQGWQQWPINVAHAADGYRRHPLGEGPEDQEMNAWIGRLERDLQNDGELDRYSTQDLLDWIFGIARRDHFTSMGGPTYDERLYEGVAREVCRRILEGQATLLRQRVPKDPREIRVIDPACGSGHFLLYAFDLLLTIYDEAYDDEILGPRLQADFPDRARYRELTPALILEHNLHGVDIDRRAAQIAALALYLRAQRAWNEMGLTRTDRPGIARTHIVCAEPMPGDPERLEEFLRTLPHPALAPFVRNVVEKMQLAGVAGSLLKIETDLRDDIEEARRLWLVSRESLASANRAAVQAGMDFGDATLARPVAVQKSLELSAGLAAVEGEAFFETAEREVLSALEQFARSVSNGAAAGGGDADGSLGLYRRLFRHDAAQGFAFVDLCRKKFDVVLMNPPFGDTALPSKEYVDSTYGDTKGDVYKAFVECFQDRLIPAGLLGCISSRTGFFLGQGTDWRERILLRLYHPLLLADLGAGVLDAMVETAAYVLRNITSDERKALSILLFTEITNSEQKEDGQFTIATYAALRGRLKRHQAEQELAWLVADGLLSRHEGSPGYESKRRAHARYSINRTSTTAPRNNPSGLRGSIQPATALICLRLLAAQNNRDREVRLLHASGDQMDGQRFTVNPQEFRQIPGSPFVYWVSRHVRELFQLLPPFESEGRTVRAGLQTSDDLRFVRNWWEVRPSTICPPSFHGSTFDGPYCVLGDYRWFPFAKGGVFSPYYSDLNLVVDWHRDGEQLKEWVVANEADPGTATWSRSIRSWTHYFRPGLTYSDRTRLRFAPRVLPAGSIISVKGSGAYAPSTGELWSMLGVTNSTIFAFLMDMLVGNVMLARSYQAGTIGRLPYPTPCENLLGIAILAQTAFDVRRQVDTKSEISHVFQAMPFELRHYGSIAGAFGARVAAESVVADGYAAVSHEIDHTAFVAYDIAYSDQMAADESAWLAGPIVASREAVPDGGDDDESGDDLEARPKTSLVRS